MYSPTSELTPLTNKIHLPSNIKDILSSIKSNDLNSTDEAAADDSEKKCRDPRQRISSVNPAEPPGLEDEFRSPCKPNTRSLHPPSFATPYMAPVNYAASMPYHYLPHGYVSDVYPNQYGSQQPPPPPPSMTIGQNKYNNYNQSSYSYNSSGYQQPPPPPSYTKNKKGSGFWVGGNTKVEPKKKKFKKSLDRRNKNSWRR